MKKTTHTYTHTHTHTHTHIHTEWLMYLFHTLVHGDLCRRNYTDRSIQKLHKLLYDGTGSRMNTCTVLQGKTIISAIKDMELEILEANSQNDTITSCKRKFKFVICVINDNENMCSLKYTFPEDFSASAWCERSLVVLGSLAFSNISCFVQNLTATSIKLDSSTGCCKTPVIF